MDNLTKLRHRKAELQVQIEQEQSDLKKTLLAASEALEPSNLLKKAVIGSLGFPKNEADTSRVLNQLLATLSWLAGMLIKNPKIGLLLKFLIPVALKYLPKLTLKEVISQEETPRKSGKAKVYSRLRRGVSNLRSRLRKGKEPELITE